MSAFPKDQTYGSIDELLGRNISPMNDFVEELTNHRKFVDLTEDELDTRLKEQKEANPSGIYYNICWDEIHPGYASLRVITGSTPRSHHIGIVWNGFTWGPNTYSNLDKLLNDFKKNPRGVSSNRSTASGTSSVPSAPVPSTIGDSAARRSRWGARPATAPAAPAAPNDWAQPPSQAMPIHAVAASGGWGAPSAAFGRPPQSLPPPPELNFQPPPPSGPPPTFAQPPPRPSGPPPPFGQPPRPSGQPPTFQRPPPPPFGQPPPPPGAPNTYVRQ